jgi:predicted small secreted protein
MNGGRLEVSTARLVAAVVVVVATALAGCSSSGAPGAARDGGDDGGGGDSTTADALPPPPPPPLYDAGADGSAPVVCGQGTTCNAGSYEGLVVLSACCAPSGACGLDLGPAGAFVDVPDGCTPLSYPGVADPQCPNLPVPWEMGSDGGGSGKSFQGCCRADGTCGIFVALTPSIDLGCAAPAGFVLDAGAAIACNVAEAGPAPDAGSDSAVTDAAEGGGPDGGEDGPAPVDAAGN